MNARCLLAVALLGAGGCSSADESASVASGASSNASAGATTGSGASSTASGDASSGAGGAATTATSSGAGGGATGGSGVGGSGVGGSGVGGGNSGSPGCGRMGALTGVMDMDIQANGKARTYVLSVPAGYDPNTPLPLVFAWHGAGGDGKLARLYFGVEQASNGGAIFVYPDGLIVNGSTGWDLAIDGDDVALFDAVLSATEESHCIDDNRIFSTGHSFGGFFSNSLGCARANVLRAIAPVAGGGPFSNNCTGSLAAWLAHGTADPTVPFTTGESSRDHWLSENGCAATTAATNPSPCVAYDGCQAGADVHWCAHDGGHEWPDFAADGIWGFFASMP